MELYVDSDYSSPWAMTAFIALREKQREFTLKTINLNVGEQHQTAYVGQSLTAPALPIEVTIKADRALAVRDRALAVVTHDRWFARGFDRFLVYGADGDVYESDGPVWDEGRVARSR